MEAAVARWKNQAIEAQAKFKRFRESIREQSEHASRVVVGTALTAGGGVLAAVLDDKMPTMPVIGGDSKLAIGGLLVGAALLDVAGDYGEQLTELGGGCLAVVAHEHTLKALKK